MQISRRNVLKMAGAAVLGAAAEDGPGDCAGEVRQDVTT